MEVSGGGFSTCHLLSRRWNRWGIFEAVDSGSGSSRFQGFVRTQKVSGSFEDRYWWEEEDEEEQGRGKGEVEISQGPNNFSPFAADMDHQIQANLVSV
ncbi:hypothetical protein TorRG33x02_056600 [Trema orientale]|uniref:Uncharacterized protein n=1 Tax=Trema orientale TaxID=63057 RepID=A0A2P5FKZ5_TREOI|nr:hypothetical protein TorRG33x02_056600 [Trema orientale]